MKNRYTVNLDREVVGRAKEIAGLVPFSRYVQNLLLNEIAKADSDSQKESDH